MGPINLYETGSGDFVPAYALTVDEAVALHRRGVLEARDERHLSPAARLAVRGETRDAVASRRRRGGRGVVIYWGVRRPTRAYQGRA